MRGLFVLSAFLLAAPAFGAETAVRVVEDAPPAQAHVKARVVKAVETREAKTIVRMDTVVRCTDGACTSVSTKTATSSRVIRADD